MPEEDFVSTWKKPERGQILELPSGNKVRMMQTLDLRVALEAGTIPNPLRTALSEMLEKQDPKALAAVATDPQVLQQMVDLTTKVICESVLNPKIIPVPTGENPAVWEPSGPNEISFADLTEEDKVFIYGVATGGPTSLELFREQQKQLMASLANESEVPVPTKRTGRTTPRKGKRSSGVLS